MKLSRTNQKKWIRNTLLFLAPVALMYLGQVIGVLSAPRYEFVISDLLPSRFTQGGMVLYILNSAQDLIRKFMAGRK